MDNEKVNKTKLFRELEEKSKHGKISLEDLNHMLDLMNMSEKMKNSIIAKFYSKGLIIKEENITLKRHI